MKDHPCLQRMYVQLEDKIADTSAQPSERGVEVEVPMQRSGST